MKIINIISLLLLIFILYIFFIRGTKLCSIFKNIKSSISDTNKLSNGNKNILILYYVSYCSYCKRFFPTWKKIKNKLKNKVIFIEINGEKNKDICERDDVNLFPTIRLIKKGEKIIDYNGNRSYKDLLNFAQL
jgi:thiol-disulfide isomerase/thioredoxin